MPDKETPEYDDATQQERIKQLLRKLEEENHDLKERIEKQWRTIERLKHILNG